MFYLATEQQLPDPDELVEQLEETEEEEDDEEDEELPADEDED